MDYARKIGKPDEQKRWMRRFTTTLAVRDTLISQDKNATGDRRLGNWRTWLADRNKQYKHIKSSTGRDPKDQVLNSCETVRPFVEMKTVMDYANAPVPILPDRYRGGPEFWRTPYTIRNRGDNCLPDLTVTQSKKDLNITPELLHVDLPELIEKEKGLVDLKSKEPFWKRSRYLMRRRHQLARELELLVPKEPETKDLAIRGHGPRQRQEQPRIPPITVSDAEDEEESKCGEYPAQAIVLRIQDREIVWQRSALKPQQTDPDPITWSVTFSGNVDRREEKEVVFENKGNRVIVCEWRDAAFQSKAMPMRRQISPFFFNKTKQVIPPGQIKKLKIWYRPRSAGVSNELWRLQTDPQLCPSSLMFRFWGCAETPDTQAIKSNPVSLIDGYLNRCIRDTTIREIVSAIVNGVDKVRPPEPAYGNLFLESEIFLAKNPLCFYHPSAMLEFHKIYYSVTDQKEQRWNLSLDDLREVLLKIKQPERRHNVLSEFSRLYKQCLEPTLYAPEQANLHETVRNLICIFLNRFETESKVAKRACLAKESRECLGTILEMDCSLMASASDTIVRSSSSRTKRDRRSTLRSLSGQDQEISEDFGFVANDHPYREVFFIRIHELLTQTIKQVLAAIDSFHNLNTPDK